jgi:drug/metabolite transporter (DMT)-like permease
VNGAVHVPRSAIGPVAVLLFSASLWGLSWWPLKQFAASGLSGPVLSLWTYGVVGLCTLPWLWRERAAWRAQAGVLLALALVGGWANSAFVQALVLGDVVRVMLLFYLSPVWSVLGGWLWLGERLTGRRVAAVALALAGLWLVLGGSRVLDTALSRADLLALTAGIAFAGNNLLSRAGQQIPVASKSAVVFVGCGVWSLVMIGATGLAWPDPAVLLQPLGAAVIAYGLLWMGLATLTWQYGVTHVESGRAGVVLIAELLVAVASSGWINGERLAPLEWLGGGLIVAAALVETLSSTGEAGAVSKSPKSPKAPPAPPVSPTRDA